MPRETRKQKLGEKSQNSPGKRRSKSVANVNNSHANYKTRSKSVESDMEHVKTDKRIKSKVVKKTNNDNKNVNTESVTFDEEGETVHMEISDGGAAAVEFQSDNGNMTDSQESESESDQSEIEYGEIQSNTEDTDKVSSQNRDNDTDYELDEASSKRHKSKMNRSSVEDQLHDMSNTLMAMQELLMKKGISMENEPERKVVSKTPKGNKDQNTESGSVTTIYQNVLDKIDSSEGINNLDDPEISFNPHGRQGNQNSKMVKGRDSSSSEEGKIDTSDEMMEVDCDKFIADCEAQASSRCKRIHAKQETNEAGESQLD